MVVIVMVVIVDGVRNGVSRESNRWSSEFIDGGLGCSEFEMR